MAVSISATSRTVRPIGPDVSWKELTGMMPRREIKAIVGRRPTVRDRFGWSSEGDSCIGSLRVKVTRPRWRVKSQ